MQFKSLYCNGSPLIKQVYLPGTFLQRARGLLGKAMPGGDEGYFFSDCHSIHMFGMTYCLDIVFIDAGMKVCKLIPELAPWRLAYSFRAAHTLELSPGSISRLTLKAGQSLELR